jgi:hypothetical protein
VLLSAWELKRSDMGTRFRKALHLKRESRIPAADNIVTLSSDSDADDDDSVITLCYRHPDVEVKWDNNWIDKAGVSHARSIVASNLLSPTNPYRKIGDIVTQVCGYGENQETFKGVVTLVTDPDDCPPGYSLCGPGPSGVKT